MSPLYKEGLYWLILLAVVTVAYAVVAIFVGTTLAMGTCFLFFLGFFMPLVYRKQTLDERDQKIAHNALIAGYSIFWLAFTLGVVGLWGVLFSRGQETVSIHVLTTIVGGGGLVFFTTRAVAIVVQYHWQNADER
jgi:hypothetical protein